MCTLLHTRKVAAGWQSKMTQQYLAGELSLLLWQLQAAMTNEPSAVEVAQLRQQAERGPRAALASVVERALEVADRACRDSLACRDAAALMRQAEVCSELWEFGVCAGLLEEGRKALSADSEVSEFENSWADGVRWRKSRWLSVADGASVIVSQDGRPGRVLRPGRIEFVAEPDGEPERELKASLAGVFEQQQSVERAYLSRVKYDEGPETAFALCLVSASPMDVGLLEGIRKTFARLFDRASRLDIIFVIASDVARLESVCRAFYERTRLLH